MKDKHPNNKENTPEGMEALSRHLKEQSMNLDDFLSEEEWQKFLQQRPSAHHNEEEETSYHQVYRASLGRTKRKKAIISGSAAIAILVIIISSLYYMSGNHNSPVTQIAAFTYKNISANPEQLSLPDRSVIFLYPGSEIKYQPDYNSSHRQVSLSGKAVFTVAPKAGLPFTVYCQSIATTALGTKFQVDGQTTDPRVHLYEGKIVIRRIQDSTIKRYPVIGETIAFIEKENKFYTVTSKAPQTLANIPGRQANNTGIAGRNKSPGDNEDNAIYRKPVRNYLNFSNKKLSTVFDYLARQYKVEIHYPTELAEATNVMFSIDASQPIDRILDNICQTTGMTLKQSGDKVFTISK
ncbi:FecR family protein [Filimonas effusa]|uniref:FecR family protein n=1 Tax=Filimonas effusa TaxID=2508721 RepID=A0A4Q1D5Z2_9BACT|nr:FecR family protein [Filimonas effusa]RXK83101.1 FecR family protein [Filimonas effusa]